MNIAFLSASGEVLAFAGRSARAALLHNRFYDKAGQLRARLDSRTAPALRDLLHKEKFTTSPQLVQRIYELCIAQ